MSEDNISAWVTEVAADVFPDPKSALTFFVPNKSLNAFAWDVLKTPASVEIDIGKRIPQLIENLHMSDFTVAIFRVKCDDQGRYETSYNLSPSMGGKINHGLIRTLAKAQDIVVWKRDFSLTIENFEVDNGKKRLDFLFNNQTDKSCFVKIFHEMESEKDIAIKPEKRGSSAVWDEVYSDIVTKNTRNAKFSLRYRNEKPVDHLLLYCMVTYF
nr:hypothetical protein GGHGEOLK_00159 [White spot syndrome virus]BDX28267.1 MAG: hypothetical protein [White spot syndrome virus]